MAIQKCLLNQCTGLPRCARNDNHIELISALEWRVEREVRELNKYRKQMLAAA